MTSDHVQQRIVLLLTQVHEAARAGDWLDVRRKTELVLRLNPFNHDARAYWALAKNGGIDPHDTVETRIAGHLDAARIALEAGDWETVGNECRIVLGLDVSNAEAEGYLRTAEETILRDSKKGGPRHGAVVVAPMARRANASYTFIENGGLTTLTAGLIAILSVLYLLAGGYYLWGAGLVSGLDNGETTFSESRSFDDNATIVAILLVAGFIAGGLLFYLWLFREISSTRAMGLKTLAPPGLSVGLSVFFGLLGSYIFFRDLASRVRGYTSIFGEVLLVAWLAAGIGGTSLSGTVVKEPANNAEWADLLRLTAYASFLLAAAGICFAYSIWQTHEELMQRYLEPRQAPQSEQAREIAA